MAKKKEMDQLTKDCIEARKAGLSYGKWKAMQPPREMKPKQKAEKPSNKRCRVCGKEIPMTSKRMVYCSDECGKQYDYHYNRNRKYVEEVHDGLV